MYDVKDAEKDDEDSSLIRNTPRASISLSPLYLLHAHLTHPSNAHLLPALHAAAAGMGQPFSQLLRLLCATFFHASLYQMQQRLARGAFGVVCTCQTNPPLHGAPPLAVKLIDARFERFHKSNVGEVLTEVMALHQLRGESRVAQLVDFGFDGAAFWLVMHRYDGTLREWVSAEKRPLQQLLDLYAQVLQAVCVLERHNVSYHA